MAAFSTSVQEGLIPQARHGAIGVSALAVLGSKFAGSGLEKEHIGQTHVAVARDRAGEDRGGPKGLSARPRGEAERL